MMSILRKRSAARRAARQLAAIYTWRPGVPR